MNREGTGGSPQRVGSDAPKFAVAPDSRPYVHRRCKGTTVVGGGVFRQLCNPYAPATATECVPCGQIRPLGEFAWADTGESLDAYRARLRSLFPGHAVKRRLVGFGSVVLGTVLGVAVGIPFASTRTFAPPFIGGIVGFLLGVAVAVRDMFKHRIDGRQYC